MLLIVSGLLLFGSLSIGCDTGDTSNKPDPTKECVNHRTCWKKVCPQTDPNAYKTCVDKELDNQDHLPQYAICGSDNKCTTIPASDLGSGQIEVSFPPETKSVIAKDQVKWLRFYIFPNVDLDGKKIDCKRLEDIYKSDPKKMMSPDLNRYSPPPSWTKPLTTDVTRIGDTLTLLFNEQTVPKSTTNILVLQGFCNPSEGRPELETKHKWWACKENITTKAGKDSNRLSIVLPVKNADRCP